MTSISISSIDTANRLRTLDPDWVAVLAEEIAVDGLVEPIRVAQRGNGYKLITGARRIAAHLKLGWDEIEATIEDEADFADDTAVRLAEIKGHMLRGDLTALDRAVTVSAWCDLYKAENGSAKPGRKAKLAVVEGSSDEALEEMSVTMTLNWSDAAQSALRLGRKTLFRHLKIARKIDADLRARIALHPIANSQRDLMALAEMTPVRQSAIVDLLTSDPAKAETVAEAIAKLDEAPTLIKPSRVDKLVERFSGLGETDKFKFFDRNADLIEAWFARRRKKAA
ncbi:ParB N-terminal domain-containing protein [Jiella pacifica]|uniref:ParB N-terminal domain-containing protein n=1 Tax=Jiella pacifica TaxID=2696469 RepID=A0A6N9T510_9HYPH|nr:ParB N-terminal domain-containing protein [Jiella pacifica]NDW04038.1 ParB N-terminal domain-containing protein [Jiella pacifica]